MSTNSSTGASDLPTEPSPSSERAGAGRWARALSYFSVIAYPLYCGIWVLVTGAILFGSMRAQLELSVARETLQSAALTSAAFWPDDTQPLLSAPLDDTFIYFDFARSAAELYPLQWSVGNGYSSGCTSILYPFVLAIGYALGYQGLWLVLWAGVVACVSVWGFLLAIGGAFVGRWQGAKYLAPPLLLSVGALDWTLFSGMEGAFLLGVWGGCFVCWQRLLRALKASAPERATQPPAFRVPAALLGVLGLLLAWSRPEAAALVFLFAALALQQAFIRLGWAQRVQLVLLSVGPALVGLLLQGIANFVWTGEWQAAGAVAKLVVHDQRSTPWEIRERILGNVAYGLQNVFGYYLGAPDPVARGDGDVWMGRVHGLACVVVVGAALAPLFDRRLRRACALLWLSALAWLCIVAQNGTIDWHNDRYLMPAVAWMSVSAALGFGVLAQWLDVALRWAWSALRGPGPGVFTVATTWATLIGVTVALVCARLPELRYQVWFFGRAARNIYDQQVATGERLQRFAGQSVLVGDAGAIPYVSNLAAVDIAGLGGLGQFPFARASRLGLAAAVEVLQAVPPARRPGLMALYPSWFKELPLWFGERLFEVRTRGNVICGDEHKVVYRTRWEPLDDDFAPAPSETLRTELDFADVSSERDSELKLIDGLHKVEMKLLSRDWPSQSVVWDGGRVLAWDAHIQAVLRGLTPGQPARLYFRLAPSQPTRLAVSVGGQPLVLDLAPGDNWQEPSFDVAGSNISAETKITIESLNDDVVLYHLWVVQRVHPDAPTP